MRRELKNIGKNLKVFLIFMIIMSFSLNSVFAQENFDIGVIVPPSFQKGDTLSFEYSLFSEVDSTLFVKAGIECPQFYIPPSGLQELQLESNRILYGTYDERFVIGEYIESQTCVAYVQILSPVEQREEKTFQIITDPSFGFSIILDKKVFIKDENIFLDYNSDVENPTIKATLTLPDKTTKQLNLPTTIKAEQIGTYELEITAEKEGYKTQSVKEQFGVIEEEANIGFTASRNFLDTLAQSITQTVENTIENTKKVFTGGKVGKRVCNQNGICDDDESYEVCPNDCPPEPLSLNAKIFIGVGILLFVMIVGAIAFTVVVLNRKKR